jgi:hypothetical protein
MNLNPVDYVAWVIFGIIFVVGLGLAGFSFERPRGVTKDFKGRLKEPVWWQKVLFFVWTVGGPLYLVYDYYNNGATLEQIKFAHFTHKQKLFTDVWGATAVLFGLFWGLKR